VICIISGGLAFSIRFYVRVVVGRCFDLVEFALGLAAVSYFLSAISTGFKYVHHHVN
jgi:hypothetical protein